MALLGLAGFGALVTVFGALRDDAGPPPSAPPGVQANATAPKPVPPPSAPDTVASLPPSAAPQAPAVQAPQAETGQPATPPAQAAQPPAPPAYPVEAPTGRAPQPLEAAQPPSAPSPAPPARSSAALAPPAAPPPVPSAPKPAPSRAPSFDLVRVEPTGESVIAGRAAPGAVVELLRDGAVHDRVTADASGAFSFVAPPLPPGPSQLSLRALGPGGAVASEQGVTVVVAPRRDEAPLVALASPERPTALLSTPVPASPVPGAAPAPASAEAARPPVRVETVEAEEGGRLYVSGRAPPGATVRLYLNDTPVASGTATEQGRIAFSIEGGVSPGDYRVRLDDAEAGTGRVRSRAQVPFAMPRLALAAPAPPRPDPAPPAAPRVEETARQIPGPGTETAAAPTPPSAPLAAASPEPSSSIAATPVAPPPPARADAPAGALPAGGPPGAPVRAETASADAVLSRAGDPGLVVVPRVDTAIVSRGDSLWRISRRIYGQGLRFTVIYDANQPQIRDPDRIYPGQVFVLPGEGAPL